VGLGFTKCTGGSVGVFFRTLERKAKSHARGTYEKKEKSDVPTCLPFLEIFGGFRYNFRKYFMVFLSSSCRETTKNAIKQNRRENTTRKQFFSTFLAKGF
jgi:hypothetical protein